MVDQNEKGGRDLVIVELVDQRRKLEDCTA